MNRREFISLLGGAAVWPLAARAQQAGKLPTIGFLGGGTPTGQRTWVAALVQRLRELGWIEGRTVTTGARDAPSASQKSRPSWFGSTSTSFSPGEPKRRSRQSMRHR